MNQSVKMKRLKQHFFEALCLSGELIIKNVFFFAHRGARSRAGPKTDLLIPSWENASASASNSNGRFNRRLRETEKLIKCGIKLMLKFIAFSDTMRSDASEM